MFAKSSKLSPAPSVQGFLEQLPHSLVEEILLRLPLSSLFRSRCVSHLFLSLSTSPLFIRQLHRSPFHPFALLLQHASVRCERQFFLCYGELQIKLSGFSLDFFSDSENITVMGACEDLLLCCNRETFQRDYFLVNPFTRQWLALPPTIHQHIYVLTGFVCEPSSIAEAKEGGKLRYRVVRIPAGSTELKKEFNVEIFSSEDGQWKEYVMTFVEAMRPQWWKHIAVSCHGILYWNFLFGGGRVMRLDPFNLNKREISTIQNAPGMLGLETLVLPIDIGLRHLLANSDGGPKKSVIGICRGKLKMSEMVWMTTGRVSHLNIWEMETGESKWRMAKVVPLQEIILANPLAVDPFNLQINLCSNLAFHPTDEDIIYLEIFVRMKVICCNIKMRSMEIVSDLNPTFYLNADAFPLLLPLLPTPIPALP